MKSHFYLLVLVAILLTNCIQTPDPDIPKRVSYQFLVNNVGTDISTDTDTINVNEIKLLAEKFNVQYQSNGGGKIQTRVDGMVMKYTPELSGEENLILGVNIGYEDINQFDAMELFINPPSNQDNIQDNDFFGTSSNYSIIMKGTYNSRDFVYKSDTDFIKLFDFDSIKLTESDHTLVLRVLADIEQIVKENGNIIEPNSNNASTIDSLLQHSMRLESFPTDVIQFQ